MGLVLILGYWFVDPHGNIEMTQQELIKGIQCLLLSLIISTFLHDYYLGNKPNHNFGTL